MAAGRTALTSKLSLPHRRPSMSILRPTAQFHQIRSSTRSFRTTASFLSVVAVPSLFPASISEMKPWATPEAFDNAACVRPRYLRQKPNGLGAANNSFASAEVRVSSSPRSIAFRERSAISLSR